MTNFSIRLPKDQREAVSKIAKANGLKDADVMRAALRNYLRSAKKRNEAA